MRVVFILCILRAACFSQATASGQNDTTISTIVDLDYATYQGEQLTNGINQYLGMRYAAPPLGNYRWRAPADPSTETAIQPATTAPPACVGSNQNISSTLSEDCLYVNVFTPSNALPTQSFRFGSTFKEEDSPRMVSPISMHYPCANQLSSRFVGFLASEKIKLNGNLNAGLLDQRKALLWVQKYIIQFGGDPDHVVIHGDSAGSASVALQLAAHGGRDDGLFIGAISQSPYFIGMKAINDTESQFTNVSTALNCSSSADQLSCIRSKDTAAIQALNLSPTVIISSGAALVPNWAPCIDGEFIRNYPNILYQEGSFVKVPIITSDDTNEGTGFVTNASTKAQVSEFMSLQFSYLSDTQLQAIESLYPLMAPLPLHAAYFPSLAQAYGEAVFICPGLEIASSQSSFNDYSQVWNYRYNVEDQIYVAGGYGVPHVSENTAVFGVGPTGSGIGVNGSYSTYNAPIVPIIQTYFINFIKYLDPNGVEQNSTLTNWDNFESGHEQGQKRLLFKLNNITMESIPEEQLERCSFWAGATLQTQI
ncbi:secreted lipase-like protein 1 [Botrytis cinerea]